MHTYNRIVYTHIPLRVLERFSSCCPLVAKNACGRVGPWQLGLWMGWDGMGWDGMGWDGMGWDGMGWDGMGWDEVKRDETR